MKLSKTGNFNHLPKKVLCVWNYLEWGGAQVYFLALMKEAKKHCEARAVLPEGSNEQLLKFLKDFDLPYEFVDSHTDSQPALTLKRKLARHFNKLRSEYVYCRYLKKFDLKSCAVHVEFAPWQSFAALFWLCTKTKVFTTVHNSVRPQQWWRGWIWKFKFGVLSKFKNFHIFTANEDAKKCLREFVSPEFYDRVKVTYASINPPELLNAQKVGLDKKAICQKFNIPADKFLVLCVGQFIDRKGRWIFLEAAQKLLKENSDFAFVWISNSKPGEEDLHKAESFGLDENFVLITSEQVGKERGDLFNLMRLADIFALPSFVEGLPISMLEAMALGKAVVSTNINGIPEAVKHLETGWLIEPNNVDALVKAVRTLKNDKTLREKLARNGSEFVLKNFDERIAAQMAWQSYEESFSE
ncbi:MAG TPA: glycosyltransferase family 4 protein [Pyrinomonadaceae bacterium]